MCWNADISLNTFVFGLLSILFIFFTNTFSKYKIQVFSNPLYYIYMLNVVSVQLVEFFLWRNINNRDINRVLSFICLLLVGTQPLILILFIRETFYRNTLLILYGLFSLLFFTILKYKNIYTSIAKNGHLDWNWSHLDVFLLDYLSLFLYLSMYLIPLYFIGIHPFSFFIIITLAVSMYFYIRDKTVGTMWCWIANSAFLLILFYILIVLPYKDYNGLC